MSSSWNIFAVQVAYLIVDEMHHEHPELIKDQYWDDVFPPELPYTLAAEQYREEPPGHSTDKIQVSKQNGEIVPHQSLLKLDEMGMGESGVRIKNIHASTNFPVK